MTVLWSGVICVSMLALGFGFLAPVSTVLGDIANLIAVVCGIVFVGLREGE